MLKHNLHKESKLYFCAILSILLLSGCKSKFGKFNDTALEFASDNQISQSEYEALTEQVKASNERGFLQFKDEHGKINDDQVSTYLVKYFKAKKLAITSEDIWQPSQNGPEEKKFNINVFLENSASMDGYVKGVTEFETAIYNLLGDIKISEICDSLNLNYINDKIPYSKQNALPPDIQDFIEKLEPSTFKRRGGNRSTSDLKNILNTVLGVVDDQNAAILISDFVFSPGSEKNALDYLNNQGVGIKIDFAQKLQAFDLSVVFIQLQSRFKGKYYDKTNAGIPLSCQRPYYIMVLGSSAQVNLILKQKMLDNIKGGYQNRLVFQQADASKQPPTKILYRPKIGNFSAKKIAKGIIQNAAPARSGKQKGIFGFSLAVDFSNSPYDAAYFLDKSNYRLSNTHYSLSAEKIADKNDPALAGFTHMLKLQTNNVLDEALKIEVIGNTPAWVYASTSTDDASIAMDSQEQSKTFGLKYLVEGVADAFYPKSEDNSIYTMNITIKR